MLQRVAAGEETAFRELFHFHWDNLLGVALLFVKNSTYAEELVQDIFLRIWQNRDKLPAVQDFRSYLFITARNYIYTALRKKSVETAFTEELLWYFTDPVAGPEQRYLDKETAELLRQAVQQLPTQQRAVYEMAREQGLSHEEIAERLQLSKNTVRNHMARAMESIRKRLEWLMILL